MKRKAGKHWRYLHGLGARVDLRVFKASEAPEGSDLHEVEGLCDVENSTIYLLDQELGRMHDALMHEWLHFLWEKSGLGSVGEACFRKGKSASFEETACRLLSPSLIGTLGKNGGVGWLRLPKIPKRK
jgi:hypothetical protein